MPHRAFSILGRTLFQSSPPRPLPSGGTAIDRRPRSRTNSLRAFNPASMSSMRLAARQWRFVGKLTMNRGFPISPVSNVNNLPGRTSPRRQAAAYALKFSGKALLNCSAIPRPMMPTQLTALTRASASSSSMSPMAKRIKGRSALGSILPVRPDFDEWWFVLVPDDFHRMPPHVLRLHGGLPDQPVGTSSSSKSSSCSVSP